MTVLLRGESPQRFWLETEPDQHIIRMIRGHPALAVLAAVAAAVVRAEYYRRARLRRGFLVRGGVRIKQINGANGRGAGPAVSG